MPEEIEEIMDEEETQVQTKDGEYLNTQELEMLRNLKSMFLPQRLAEDIQRHMDITKQYSRVWLEIGLTYQQHVVIALIDNGCGSVLSNAHQGSHSKWNRYLYVNSSVTSKVLSVYLEEILDYYHGARQYIRTSPTKMSAGTYLIGSQR